MFALIFPSWQPETKFLFSRSRLPLKDAKGPFTFVENQEIEVYSKANEQEAFGWWKAVIKVFMHFIYTFFLSCSLYVS